MRKVFLLIIFFVATNIVSACVCGIESLLERYQRSDFIATAKILKIYPDRLDKDYHIIEIEISNIYKGNPITSLKIRSAFDSSCSFFTPEDSAWLIFASKEKDGELSFGRCSGSIQLDKKFDLKEYPNAIKDLNRKVEASLSVLQFLKDNNIKDVNKYNLYVSSKINYMSDFKNFEGGSGDGIAIYELDVDKDLRINKIKALKKFDDNNLTKIIKKGVKKNLRVVNYRDKSPAGKSKIICICYTYSSGQNNQKIISFSGYLSY